MKIGARNIHRVFVDDGSLVNILYYECYKKMGLLDKDMIPKDTHVYIFTRDSLIIKGTIKLHVTLGEDLASATQMADFVIIDHPSCYNVVIGRPILRDMRVVTSIYYLSMKFPTHVGVGCVRGCSI